MSTSPYRDQDVVRRMFTTPFAVEFAYPTSTISARLGHGRAGCYYVSAFVDENTPRRCVSVGYPTLEEARADCKRREHGRLSTTDTDSPAPAGWTHVEGGVTT